MTAKELAAACLNVANYHKTVYMWGTFGAPVTESVIVEKSKQYPTWYTAARQASFRKLIGKGYFGFDCVNLIKGILWGWSGNATKTYGGAGYATNGVPDTNADGAIKCCTDISTDFTGVEVGEALWLSGHFGIYIGDGLAVECTPRWSNGVQVTAVANMGSKSGYNARKWTKHGKMPWVEYKTDTAIEEDNEVTQEQFEEMLAAYQSKQSKKTASSWAKDAWTKATEKGVFDGTMPQAPMTREQGAAVLDRLGQLG